MNGAALDERGATPVAERSEMSTRLLKCALEVEESRAYWQRAAAGRPMSAVEAFEGFCFGAKSLDRVGVLLANMRARFDAFPEAMPVLRAWPHMQPGTRALICHWHLQLSDPLYRRFTAELLVTRRASLRPSVTRDLVFEWVSDQGPGRWTIATRLQFASKLLSAAFSAGLVGSNRDPRPLPLPRVDDEALGYLLHLLRGVHIEGNLLDNAYLRSVGLGGAALDDRLSRLSFVDYQRQGGTVSLSFAHANLADWARSQGLQPSTEVSP